MDSIDMDKFISDLKDSVICDLTEIVKKLTIEIDKYYIRRSDHNNIIQEMEKKYENSKNKNNI